MAHLPTIDATLLVFGLTASAQLAGVIVWLSLDVAPANRWRRILMSWPMQQIGKYSYAIYVLHFPLAYVLEQSNLITRLQFGVWIPHRLSAELAYSAVMTALSILAGALSWHLCEKHVLALRKHLPYR